MCVKINTFVKNVREWIQTMGLFAEGSNVLPPETSWTNQKYLIYPDNPNYLSIVFQVYPTGLNWMNFGDFSQGTPGSNSVPDIFQPIGNLLLI